MPGQVPNKELCNLQEDHLEMRLTVFCNSSVYCASGLRHRIFPILALGIIPPTKLYHSQS